jgi:beta propeller repeat protein
MRSKILLIASIFIFFVVLATVASAAQVTKIGNGSEPAICDSKVVWTDGSIHVYDLATKKDTKISSSSASYPAIYDNKLVWHDESSGTPGLTLYDIKTSSRSQITKNVDEDSIPAIYGSKIVWSANNIIYMRDISKSTQSQIVSGNSPDIYDTKIVYDSDIAGDTPQIYVYDITTKKSINASQYGDNMFSHIYGNKVIWSDYYTRLGNIRMYDIATKQQTDITTGDDMTGYDTGGATDINGNKIVYLKHKDLANINSGDVYVYNMATGQSTQLSSGNTAQTPVVSGNIVVWSDSGSIYMSDLAATNVLPPVAAFTANRASGTHPLKVKFTSTSTGCPETYLWDFGDGINSKHKLTATHTFTKAGKYTVSLIVTNSAGSDTLKKTKYITVK